MSEQSKMPGAGLPDGADVSTGEDSQTATKKLARSIVTVILLAVGLCITSIALAYSTVSVRDNRFQTGIIEINLNDGEPVIREHEFLFEPGMTVEKQFFIQNQSTWDVYYRLYLEEVEGGLADYLEVTILDGDRVLYQGTASEMTKNTSVAAEDLLKLDERRDLTIRFYFPPEAGNEAQDLTLSFVLCADAVQTKNNPYKLFD